MESSWDARLEGSISPISKKRKMFNEPAAQSAYPNSAPASNLAKDNLHGRLEEVFNTRIRAYAICAIDEASMLHSKISTYSTEEDQLRLMSMVAPEFLNGCATAHALGKVSPGTEELNSGFISAPWHDQSGYSSTSTTMETTYQTTAPPQNERIVHNSYHCNSPPIHNLAMTTYGLNTRLQHQSTSAYTSSHFTSGPPIPDIPSSPYTVLTYPSPRRYDFSTSKWVEDPMYSFEMNGLNMEPMNEDHGS
ncbi:hypothetical protein BP5796_12323 [Coleophoma crateriformis]|uniref:Uncharacterized protein n=1 Tax=Coleophoma crateriformis TaxID=565419 RepID=A0A3D8Q973_9HELO|nr:hypothetical protein BP5796_12323 [Coleophoma crateriformis]